MWTRTTPSVLALAAVLGACGPGQVVITAEVEVPNTEGEGMTTQPLQDKEVQLIPFNRDALFDSLEAAASTPEPPIPDSVSDLVDQVIEAQAAWRAQDSRWQTLRDSLRTLGQALEGLDPASSQYTQMYGDWVVFDREVSSIESTKEGLFNEFTSLQARTEEIFRDLRLERERWADEAFADYGAILEARTRAGGRDIVTDTTDVNGMLTVELPPGEWWVHARHALPFQELYWNIPIVVTRDEPVQVRLTRATAEIRRTLR